MAVDLEHRLLVGVTQHFEGNGARWRGDLAGARALYESALAIYRREAHRMWEATALAHLAFVLYESDDMERAATCANESLRLFKAAGNTWGISRAVRVLGRVAARRSDTATAVSLHEASLALDQAHHDAHGSVHSMIAMADDMDTAGNAAQAWRLYYQSLLLADRSGNRLFTARGLEGLARLSATREPARAVRFAAVAYAVREQLGGPEPTSAQRERLAAALESALRSLGGPAFNAAWTTGLQTDFAGLLAALPPEVGAFE